MDFPRHCNVCASIYTFKQIVAARAEGLDKVRGNITKPVRGITKKGSAGGSVVEAKVRPESLQSACILNKTVVYNGFCKG
jgi:hypothetical protein